MGQEKVLGHPVRIAIIEMLLSRQKCCYHGDM